MKKLARFVAPLALLAVIGATDRAEAEPNGVLSPRPTVIRPSIVEGTIAVPSLAGDKNLSSFTCADLVVTATSRDTGPLPPGGFVKMPKWTRTANATGEWQSGRCRYAMAVPAGSAFFVSATAHGEKFPACGLIVAEVGGATQAVTVPRQTTMPHSFRIASLVCEPPIQ